VSLEHVGIALANEPPTLREQRRLVETIAAQDPTKSRRVGQRDGHDAIALARRRRKLVTLTGHDLDVERQAPQVVEAETAERRAAREHQILVHGIRKESVGRLRGVGGKACGGAAALARGQRRAPAVEARQPPKLARTLKPRERHEPGRVADERGIRGEQKRLERNALHAREGAVADPEADGVTVVGEGGGDEPGRGIGAEEQRGRGAQPAASSTAARYMAASTRPTSTRPVCGTITVGIERMPSATAAS